MSTILESVNTLSEKLGVTEREQTIKDQLDLCVERLGGEGNSKDIAESAEKFAEKEDGTATFMTKTITENDTYNAADDGVSGYSSVTVNVPSAPTPETITVNMTLVADAATTSATQATVTTDKTYEEVKTVIQNGGKVTFNITYSVEGVGSESLTVLCYDYNDGTETGIEGIIIFTILSFYRTIIWAADSESAFIQSQTGQNILIASL